jgi:hypothetical protein
MEPPRTESCGNCSGSSYVAVHTGDDCVDVCGADIASLGPPEAIAAMFDGPVPPMPPTSWGPDPNVTGALLVTA